MKTFKLIVALVFVALLQWSCGDNNPTQQTVVNDTENNTEKSMRLQNEGADCFDVSHHKSATSRQTKIGIYEKWFVYDQPINGYNVKIHWLCDKAQLFSGTGYFYFSNSDTTKMLTHEINVDIWFDETRLEESPDTIVLNQYYQESTQPYLDWRAIVGFADYNFDGKKDLVICGSPRPYRELDKDDWLDCEDFTFYSDFPEGFVQIHNEPFYRLSTGACRTYCKFDPTNETLLLLTSDGACCSDSTTYYFRDGSPYKSLEVKHEQQLDTTINETTILHYGTSKFNTIIGTVFGVCFFGALCIYSIYKTNVL